MTDKDWICPVCGQEMRYKDGSLACDEIHGALHPHYFCSLPVAICYDYKRFKIFGCVGWWEYARGAHVDCFRRKPKQGTIVARVTMPKLGGEEARTLCRTKPPRNTKEEGRSSMESGLRTLLRMR